MRNLLTRNSLVRSAIVAAMFLSGTASLARAEDCDDETGGKKDGQNFHVEYRDGKKIHVIDTVITVCGKVPRPSVVYVLQAKNLNYEWEVLKQDFLPLIVTALAKAPF